MEKNGTSASPTLLSPEEFYLHLEGLQEGHLFGMEAPISVLLGIMKIIHDLFQKILRFVFTCHICKFNSLQMILLYFRIALAKGHCSARAAAHGTHHLLTQPAAKKDEDHDWEHILPEDLPR